MRVALLTLILRNAKVQGMDLRTYLSAARRGEASRLSKKIGVSPVLISQWASGTRPVPAEHCPALELETGGAVNCEALNASEPWRRIADKSWPHPKGRPVLDFAQQGA